MVENIQIKYWTTDRQLSGGQTNEQTDGVLYRQTKRQVYTWMWADDGEMNRQADEQA